MQTCIQAKHGIVSQITFIGCIHNRLVWTFTPGPLELSVTVVASSSDWIVGAGLISVETTNVSDPPDPRAPLEDHDRD